MATLSHSFSSLFLRVSLCLSVRWSVCLSVCLSVRLGPIDGAQLLDGMKCLVGLKIRLAWAGEPRAALVFALFLPILLLLFSVAHSCRHSRGGRKANALLTGRGGDGGRQFNKCLGLAVLCSTCCLSVWRLWSYLFLAATGGFRK